MLMQGLAVVSGTEGTILAKFKNTHCALDVDECARELDNCAQNCINSVGSFQCSCAPGFRLNSDGHTCNGL